MLGVDVCRALARHGHCVIGYGSGELDIADASAVTATVSNIKPDAVVNCAAYTNVDGCEADPDSAFRVNAIGAGNLATACCRVGCELVSISTDFVFDGASRTPYTEFDPIAPLGAYGRSKAAGEAMIRNACPRHKIVRTAWLYGSSGNCFPKTILRAAQTRPELRVVADQTGSPTSTVDLADALVQLVELPLCGTFHVVNSGHCTWHQLATDVLRLAGRTDIVVHAIGSHEWPTPAERPKYSVLRPYVWEMVGLTPLRSWHEALEEFVAGIPPQG